MKNFAALSALALVGAAMAEPKISAQSIIVNPTPTELQVKVWTDRDPSGNQTPNYRVGEKIKLYTTVNQDAYVYLFNVNPDGSIDQILPNRYASGGNFLKANTVKQFPAQGDNFSFDIGGPEGVNKVLALASKTELNLDQISQFRSDQQSGGQGFATVTVRGQQNLAQALSIVVTPIPQNTWTTDVVYYNTVSNQTPRTGGVSIDTNVQGATVYINDRQMGDAGTYKNLQPGSYRVRITAPGYSEYTTTITIKAGATANLSAQLQAQQVNLQVQSNVEGALVYVNGRNMGDIRDGDLTVKLNRGDYEVVLLAPGYRANVQQIQLRNSGQITLNLKKIQ